MKISRPQTKKRSMLSIKNGPVASHFSNLMNMFKSQEIGRGPAPDNNNNNNASPKIQALEHPRAQGFNKPFRGPNHPHSDIHYLYMRMHAFLNTRLLKKKTPKRMLKLLRTTKRHYTHAV